MAFDEDSLPDDPKSEWMAYLRARARAIHYYRDAHNYSFQHITMLLNLEPDGGHAERIYRNTRTIA